VSSAPHAALFGKLPAHGDFICRGLDNAVRDAWDEWASAGLAEAEASLGEGFAEAHDIAPPWCFISGPGPLGEGWRVGAFAPSADSAGRRFVIVVAVEALSLADAVLLGPRTAAALVDGIYKIFSERLDADAAFATIAAAAEGVGGMPACALDRLLEPRQEGVWWPHIDNLDAEQVFTGAAPAPALIPRALALVMGDTVL